MGAIKINENKVSRSSLIWRVLENITEPLTCREIAHAAAIENDVHNVSATLAMFLKAKTAKLDVPRICTISGKKSKTYIKNNTSPIEEKVITINNDNPNQKITVVIENNVITIIRE